ncbi:MAG TPA: hypothetical protein VK550_26025 [Polyangiaceae bacterium]|nr:hypothetical protein [Polyangiaceae bacterium]
MSTAPTLRFTVPVDAESPITFETLPNAQCALHVSEGGETAVVAARADGLATFRLHPEVTSNKAVRLIADCAAGDRQQRHVLELRALPGAPVPSEPPALRADSGVARPALAEADIAALSQAELLKRGYPLRPDAQRSPHSYETWRRFVSKPSTYLPTQPEATSSRTRIEAPDSVQWDRERQPMAASPHAAVNVKSGRTAGYQLLPVGSPYYFVDAVWTLPTFMGRQGASTNVIEHIGIDDGAGSAWTAGSQHTFTYIPAFGHVETQMAFCTSIPGSPTSLGLAMAPGDVIQAAVWLGTPEEGFNPWSGVGGCTFFNSTNGQVVSRRDVSLGGADYSNSGAHFFVGRTPSAFGGLSDLTWFGRPDISISPWIWNGVEASRWDGTTVHGDYFNNSPSDVAEWWMPGPWDETGFSLQPIVYRSGELRFQWWWWDTEGYDPGY